MVGGNLLLGTSYLGEERGELPLSAERSLANRAETSARFCFWGGGRGESMKDEG